MGAAFGVTVLDSLAPSAAPHGPRQTLADKGSPPCGGLTCVMGFGASAWDERFGAPRPAGLHISFGPAYDKKWHEFLRYFTISNDIYSPCLVSSSMKWWQALTDDARKASTAALVSTRGAQRGFARQTETDTMNAMKAAGVDIRTLTRQQTRPLS